MESLPNEWLQLSLTRTWDLKPTPRQTSEEIEKRRLWLERREKRREKMGGEAESRNDDLPVDGVVDYRGRPVHSRALYGGWTSALFIIGNSLIFVIFRSLPPIQNLGLFQGWKWRRDARTTASPQISSPT